MTNTAFLYFPAGRRTPLGTAHSSPLSRQINPLEFNKEASKGVCVIVYRKRRPQREGETGEEPAESSVIPGLEITGRLSAVRPSVKHLISGCVGRVRGERFE